MIMVIKLKSVADVDRFVKMAETYRGDVNVRCVHNHSVTVDGKSLISVAHLNLEDDIEVKLISSDADEIRRFENGMRQFDGQA